MIQLSKTGYGCHIGKKYMGSFAYADDIVLLAPTVASLQAQLVVCEQFSKDFNIKFNASKSKLLVFGGNSVEIKFQGHVIPVGVKECHIGNLIGTDDNICHDVIKAACCDIYSKFNLLVRQFHAVDKFIMYKLFNSYCLSLFGSSLWKLSSTKVMKPLYVAWRKCLRVILGIPSTTHCNLLHLIVEDNSIDVKLQCRFINFLHNIVNSNNKCLALCAKLLLNGSGSVVANSWNYICYKYNLNRFDLSNVKRHINTIKVPSDVESVKMKAGLIRDFLMFNSDINDQNVLDIINQLCTE